MHAQIPLLIDTPSALKALSGTRALYTDLDGTLLGIGGSLLLGADGAASAHTAEAIAQVNAAGLEVIICSGRNRIQTSEIARLLGWRGFIAELGCVIVPDRGAEPTYYLGAWEETMLRPDETPFEAIERVGALAALRREFPGLIENHDPYHLNREATHVLRGHLDREHAQRVLDGLDLPVEILDNGIIHPSRTTLSGVDEVHAYHLIPAGVTKRDAVAADRARRGLAQADAWSIGDSASDVLMAKETAIGVLVANALDDVRVLEAARSLDNVFATRGHRGDGWAEAADAWLAAR
ncbi:MAG: HAD hydrolase family protein [Actinomycetota bacterium]|nr:HAD hydrolase family protein [Actinomycetota bacterium]